MVNERLQIFCVKTRENANTAEIMISRVVPHSRMYNKPRARNFPLLVVQCRSSPICQIYGGYARSDSLARVTKKLRTRNFNQKRRKVS